MKPPDKVHCFFEQSGTFKRAFMEFGIPAEDYDIQNNFGETDHVIDLFAEIEKAYAGEGSIFDTITKDDLIMAFFPCIYFCATSQMSMYWTCVNYRAKTTREATDAILERSSNRERFFQTCRKDACTGKDTESSANHGKPLERANFLKMEFCNAADNY